MMYSNSAYEQPRKKNPILAALTAVVTAFLIITLILIPTLYSSFAFTGEERKLKKSLSEQNN